METAPLGEGFGNKVRCEEFACEIFQNVIEQAQLKRFGIDSTSSLSEVFSGQGLSNYCLHTYGLHTDGLHSDGLQSDGLHGYGLDRERKAG